MRTNAKHFSVSALYAHKLYWLAFLAIGIVVIVINTACGQAAEASEVYHLDLSRGIDVSTLENLKYEALSRNMAEVSLDVQGTETMSGNVICSNNNLPAGDYMIAGGASGLLILQDTGTALNLQGFCDDGTPSTVLAVERFTTHVAFGVGSELEIARVMGGEPVSHMGSITLSGSIMDIEAKGSWLFATTFYNVSVVDASDPSNPVLVAVISQPGVMDVTVDGNYLYTGHSAGTDVINISNPAVPYQVSAISTQYEAGFSLDVENALLVRGGFNGIDGFVRVYNVVDPSNPQARDVVQMFGDNRPMMTTISDGRVFVGVDETPDNDRIDVYSLADPNNLALLSSYTTGSLAPYAMAVNENSAYVAQVWGGKFDISGTMPTYQYGYSGEPVWASDFAHLVIMTDFQYLPMITR
ncbi:hypothetical protein KC571_03045 [candidate division WWE3 bacterium]|uniref:Uncharacterized protein n=1 Tax=candidate division WWE3 bacterium TaxID=2053526 RepID=A0A955LH76_UNCKA|nr:hypothetical protein [candidate division WWE3 bacterium]